MYILARCERVHQILPGTLNSRQLIASLVRLLTESKSMRPLQSTEGSDPFWISADSAAPYTHAFNQAPHSPSLFSIN
jgi:hypothetical protein